MSELSTRPALSWQPDGEEKVTFTCASIQESFDPRLVKRERPYRYGAKLDDTGCGPITWSVRTDMFDGLIEDGVPTNQFTEIEPKLFLLCQTGKTGFLTLPTRGIVRAKVASWKRGDDLSERDVAQVDITWIEDNEEDIDFYSFEEFSARATSQSFAKLTTQDLGAIGISDIDTQSLQNSAFQLEDAAKSPGNNLQEIEARARQLAAKAAKIEQYYTSGPPDADQITNLLGVPDSYSAIRRLRNLRDTAQRAVYEQVSSQPKVIVYKPQRNSSAMEIALETKNTFGDVLQLNKNLLDVFFIPKNTPVRVYDR